MHFDDLLRSINFEGLDNLFINQVAIRTRIQQCVDYFRIIRFFVSDADWYNGTDDVAAQGSGR